MRYRIWCQTDATAASNFTRQPSFVTALQSVILNLWAWWYSNGYYTSPYCRVTDFENFLLMIQHLDHRCMYNDSGCFTAHREDHNPQALPHRGSSTGLLLNCSPKFYHVTSVLTILWPNGNWARVRIGIRVRVRVPVGMKANVRNQRAKIRRSRSRLKI